VRRHRSRRSSPVRGRGLRAPRTGRRPSTMPVSRIE